MTAIYLILCTGKLKIDLELTLLTVYAQMASSFPFDSIDLGWSIANIKGSQAIISK